MKTKVLMATMSMDIGGAETHILELSCGLVDKGFEVVVVSNGGAFVKILNKKGIKHYQVPLHNKKPWNVVKSYFQLKEIIKKEKVDIVHAHARIPAFLCSLLSKKLNFKFVTTAHFNFKTGMGLRYITRWGQKTLAVSDDLKKYLIKNYDIKDRNIFVTINGINTDSFHPDTPIKTLEEPERFKESFNLLHVTRLEDYTSKTAEGLIKNIDRLINEREDIKLIIVGHGQEFPKLNAMAKEANKRLGREVIFMEGARTNINEYIGISQGFVGVSRAALEAMAMERPVVLSGNQGYMGIYNSEKLDRAVGNNFTCRGEDAYDEQVLIKDVIELIHYTPSKLKELGKNGRETVIQYYSVGRMTNDAMKVYDLVQNRVKKNKKLKTLIFGYIGFGNNGDDAIFEILKETLNKDYPYMDITVLSNDPERLEDTQKVGSVYGFNPIKVLKAIKNNDLIIGNGGSLLQDETSNRSLFYYLSIIGFSKLFGKKVILFANGIGPITSRSNQRLVSWVINKVDLITLRDKESKVLLNKIGVHKPHIYVTADIVFTLEPCQGNMAQEYLKGEGVPLDKSLVGVAFRPWKNEDNYISIVAKVCDRLIREQGMNILFIPMQRTPKIDDYAISAKIMDAMNEKSYILSKDYTAKEVMSIIGEMDVTFNMRFHAMVFSILNNIPSLGVVYDPKITNYLKIFELPTGHHVNNLNEESLYKAILNLIENKEQIARSFENKKKELKEKAQENIYYLEKYIDKWF